MPERLKNKVCVITGAGRGIGQAAAELFAGEGGCIAVLERDAEAAGRCRQAIEAAGGRARQFILDIADPAAVSRAFAEVVDAFGGIDVLYNNASVFSATCDAAVADLDIDHWHAILNVNLHGLFYCCRAAIPAMVVRGGGAIINTASSAAILGIPRCDAYTASKGATVALTRSLAVNYGPHGIRVNCIAPAGIDTPMLRESSTDNSAFDEQAYFRQAPLGRYGTAEEVARLALFLASDESSFVSGAVLPADGATTVTSFAGGAIRDLPSVG